ncbi:MAG: hypothetical protein KY469_16550 [Actinobacteria bacterium]|nr:hypothetical protein [Actinomycetota bacterium]
MEVDTTTWIVGFAIGGAVVVIVVAVVLAITFYATRIRDQVAEIVSALQHAETNTAPLWNVMEVGYRTKELRRGAEEVRRRLGG